MVKCSECGFIAARNTETRILEEIEEQSRQDGNIGKGRYVLIPVCFAHSFNIKEKATALWMSERDSMPLDRRGRAEPEWPKYVRVILSKERECESFTKWQQGFTPKEHREMMDRERMLKWQTERDDADKKWRDEQRRLDLEWRETQESKAQNRHRWDLIIMGIIATIVISAATIGAAIITVKWGK